MVGLRLSCYANRYHSYCISTSPEVKVAYSSNIVLLKSKDCFWMLYRYPTSYPHRQTHTDRIHRNTHTNTHTDRHSIYRHALAPVFNAKLCYNIGYWRESYYTAACRLQCTFDGGGEGDEAGSLIPLPATERLDTQIHWRCLPPVLK